MYSSNIHNVNNNDPSYKRLTQNHFVQKCPFKVVNSSGFKSNFATAEVQRLVTSMFNGFPPSPSATLFHMFQARYTKSSTLLLFTMGGRQLNEPWAMQYYYRDGEILHTKLIVNIPATFLKVTTELGRTGIQTLQPNPEQFTIGAVIK